MLRKHQVVIKSLCRPLWSSANYIYSIGVQDGWYSNIQKTTKIQILHKLLDEGGWYEGGRGPGLYITRALNS